MIKLDKYGYRSAAAFLRDSNIPRSTFDAMVADPDWHIQKRVLLHQECPIDIREHYRLNGMWYQRIVAIMTKVAPSGYHTNILSDKDARVKQLVLRPYMNVLSECLSKLEVM